jgi:hypothetical protein
MYNWGLPCGLQYNRTRHLVCVASVYVTCGCFMVFHHEHRYETSLRGGVAVAHHHAASPRTVHSGGQVPLLAHYIHPCLVMIHVGRDESEE